MWSDIINSIKAQLYERATSPLISAFVMAWLLWNYRFVMVLFSSKSVGTKLAIIDQDYFATNLDLFLRGFAFPSLTAVLFLLIYPWPAQWIYGYWRKRQEALKGIRQEIENQTLLTLEESQMIRSRLREAEKGFAEDLADLKSQLDGSSEEIDRLKQDNETLRASVLAEKENRSRLEGEAVESTGSPPEETASEEQQSQSNGTATLSDPPDVPDTLKLNQALRVFALSGKSLVPATIAREIQISPVRAELLLDRLVNMALLRLIGGLYSLTDRGKRYVVEKNLDKQ